MDGETMSELDNQMAFRRTKLARLEEAGLETWPRSFDHDLETSATHQKYGDKSAEELDEAKIQVRVPGRITAIRGQGKVAFLDLSDGQQKLQLFVRKPSLDEQSLLVLENLDLGDIVGVEGQLMRTRAGELSILTREITFLAKSLRPLPEKFHGLTDVEQRYRQRYLDLIVNEESRKVFRLRSRLIREMRAFFDDHGFEEVETPMMVSIAGGAAARPFKTHHNALDIPLFLRIAPELFLKRLIVGGMPRVYEINRNFRNEGVSTQHNPEFTMVEFYWAFVDYHRLMDFTEEMFVHLAERVLGTTELPFKDELLQLQGPWQRYTIRQALVELGGVAPEVVDDAKALEEEHRKREIDLPPARDYGHLLMNLFEETVEDHLVQPTFITEFPVEVSPLSKQMPEDSRFVERFELYMARMEIANAFSELNNPEVQADRFRQQLAAKEAGDHEAHAFDHDYVRALEYGMPPAGGEGIGIDRLTMIFAGCPSIRDVILFPLLRPETIEEE